MQPLGIIRDYADLIDIVRGRVAELQITHQTLDHVAGLSDGYASKLLCEPPMKCAGPRLIRALLGAVGLKLVAVVDDEALARVQSRLVKSKRRPREQYARADSQMSLDFPF